MSRMRSGLSAAVLWHCGTVRGSTMPPLRDTLLHHTPPPITQNLLCMINTVHWLEKTFCTYVYNEHWVVLLTSSSLCLAPCFVVIGLACMPALLALCCPRSITTELRVVAARNPSMAPIPLDAVEQASALVGVSTGTAGRRAM